MTEDTTKKRTLGGSTAVDAYCLIDGFLVREDDDDSNSERVTIPVTRLPAIFGRDHEAAEPNHFFGIGTLKLFSREHFRIDYWSKGGRWGQTSSSEAFQWDNSLESSELINPENIDLDKPFFTITCLGKNGLFVQGRKVEKDQSIVIKDRTAVKASSLCFYFLRPLHPEYRAISIPSNAKPILMDNCDGDSADSPPSKKRRGFSGLQAELDLLSTDELLEQFNTAIATNVWERKHQFVGSTISVRAVMAAAQSPELHGLAAKSGDLERAEVMDWIAASERFAKWSQQMLTKLEAKSYQASITNAMVKVGFTRTAEKGRYIKWRLPQQLQPLENGTESVNPSTKTTRTNKTVSDNDSVEDNRSADEKDDDRQLNVSNDGTLVNETDVGHTGRENSTEEDDKFNGEVGEVEENKAESTSTANLSRLETSS
ncbi:hypothetical protein FisN_34Lh049 [Fistulifera solaris]|uniref:FHA domain-containing protein n=1 Tax=Fistulifera solaris TaxID=1519565 RepID=A0A1Z5JHG4_FISSO|nr:hypothetical protein FisN_34Lh049 [Fistulifera solaris]|eukprot:GAX13445.1 hypothetical protein FisN_34Lh049 [Fistulifera solaris]